MRKDIDFNFTRHPLTGDLVTKSGSSAIRQSIINIVRTNFGDRGFNVELMTNVDFSLFEPMTLATGNVLRTNIENSIRNFEPDVEIIDVEVRDSPNDNLIYIRIYYNEINNPEDMSVDIAIRRVR